MTRASTKDPFSILPSLCGKHSNTSALRIDSSLLDVCSPVEWLQEQ